MRRDYKEEFYKKNFENERNYLKFQLLNQWLRLKNRGIRFQEFFVDQQVQKIALYGLGELGQLFAEEMASDDLIHIEFGIDRNAREEWQGLKVYQLENLPNRVDAIIISPVIVTDEIEDEIYELLGEMKTFTIEEILYELSRKHQVSSRLWEV